MDCEVEAIKDDTYADLKQRNLIMIETTPEGFAVHQWFPDGVAPTSDYATAPEAIARAMQLLKVKQIVGPQDWPEVACIGTFTPDEEQRLKAMQDHLAAKARGKGS